MKVFPEADKTFLSDVFRFGDIVHKAVSYPVYKCLVSLDNPTESFHVTVAGFPDNFLIGGVEHPNGFDSDTSENGFGQIAGRDILLRDDLTFAALICKPDDNRGTLADFAVDFYIAAKRGHMAVNEVEPDARAVRAAV